MDLAVVSPTASVPSTNEIEIAILVPCFNEELTIGKVIADFRCHLPTATVYVFDNNSSDRTAEIARSAGAVVIREPRQGKGFVVQSMFRLVDADLYVMVDGDDTYPAAAVTTLIAPILRQEADMVVGSRLHDESQSRFKQLNLLGNYLFLAVLNTIFGVRLSDILSGYRSFSRTFVKTVPLVGGGFETETELTIKALEARFRITEVPVNLGVRPQGSFSKIRKFRDGLRILGTIFGLFRDYKPLTFFGVIALLFTIAGLIPGTVVLREFFLTGLVRHLPSAILAVGLVLVGIVSLSAGVILHAISRRIRELEHLIRCLPNGRDSRVSARRRELAA